MNIVDVSVPHHTRAIAHELRRLGSRPTRVIGRLERIAASGESGSTLAMVLAGVSVVACTAIAAAVALTVGATELVTGCARRPCGDAEEPSRRSSDRVGSGRRLSPGAR